MQSVLLTCCTTSSSLHHHNVTVEHQIRSIYCRNVYCLPELWNETESHAKKGLTSQAKIDPMMYTSGAARALSLPVAHTKHDTLPAVLPVIQGGHLVSL